MHTRLRRRAVQSLLVGLTVLAALFIALAPSGGSTAHAAPRAKADTTCIEHDVHLNGTNPATITCAQSVDSSVVSPMISWDHCSGGNARLYIVSSINGAWCFYDAGYIGLSPAILQVTKVRSLDYLDWALIHRCGSGWVMYYYNNSHIGTKFYFGNCDTYTGIPFDGHSDITQVSLNS